MEGLVAKPHPGQPSPLSGGQKHKLLELLMEGPKAHGYRPAIGGVDITAGGRGDQEELGGAVPFGACLEDCVFAEVELPEATAACQPARDQGDRKEDGVQRWRRNWVIPRRLGYYVWVKG